MKNQIELKEILIHWAEGANSKYDKFPKAYNSYEEANKALIPIYHDAAEFDGCYNKVKFTATFQDGEPYEGRLEVCKKYDNPMISKNVFGEHIEKFLNYLVKNNSNEEAANFLNNYNLK